MYASTIIRHLVFNFILTCTWRFYHKSKSSCTTRLVQIVLNGKWQKIEFIQHFYSKQFSCQLSFTQSLTHQWQQATIQGSALTIRGKLGFSARGPTANFVISRQSVLAATYAASVTHNWICFLSHSSVLHTTCLHYINLWTPTNSWLH